MEGFINGIPKNGWFIIYKGNPIKIDDKKWVPTILGNLHILSRENHMLDGI